MTTQTDIQYLDASTIREAGMTRSPSYGYTSSGYTVRSGAPSKWMIRLAGEARWRRVYVVCFSNVGSSFVRIKGRRYYIDGEAENAILKAFDIEEPQVWEGPKNSTHEFLCGDGERYGPHVSVYWQHCCYIVARHPDHPAGHAIESHRLITDARKAARRLMLA